MHFETVNIDALKRATDLALGPQGTDVLAKLYFAIASAMEDAHQKGFEAGYKTAEQVNADALEDYDLAFDEGYDAGYFDGAMDAEADDDEFYAVDDFDPATADEQRVIDYLNEVSDEYERAK